MKSEVAAPQERIDLSHLALILRHMPPSLEVTLATLPYRSNFRLAALVREGVPARILTELARALRITPSVLAGIVQIAPRTLVRRLATNARLKPDETERALRVGRLLRKAEDVFEDKDAAARWFNHPLRVLSGQSPLSLCATEPGAREVEHTLGRIEHGVFS